MWLLHRGGRNKWSPQSVFDVHTQKLFLLDAHHIYTQTTVVQMSAKEEEEEMLVKIEADTQTFVSGSS